jgi:hypothetical protein
MLLSFAYLAFSAVLRLLVSGRSSALGAQTRSSRCGFVFVEEATE